MSGSEMASINPDFVHQLKWYYWPRCPLLPDWRYRPANKYNEWNLYFHWLIFRLWTMGSPDIGVEVHLDDQQLIIRAHVPYLMFGFFIPLFPSSWHQKLWRYPRPQWARGEKE